MRAKALNPVTPDARLIAFGIASGLGAALVGPAVALAVAAVACMLAVVALFLSKPHTWVPVTLCLMLLLPPLPFSVADLDLPLHPAMFAFAAGLFAGWVRLRDWRFRQDEHRHLLFACAAFALWLLLSIPFAFIYSGNAVGIQSVMRWALLCLSFFVLAWITLGPGERADRCALLLKLVLAAAAITAAFAVLDFFAQFPATVRFAEQYIYLPDGPRRRAQGVFYDASALGNFCAMSLVLIVALSGSARERLAIPRALLWIAVAPLAVALLLSFSRGSMLNLAVALVVLVWLKRNALLDSGRDSLSAGRLLLAGILPAVIAVAAIGFVAAEIAGMYARRLEFTALQFFESPNEVLSMRLDAWRAAWQTVTSQPQHLLFGIGYKTLPYTDYLTQSIIADNMYLSLLVETGIPGVAALLALCAAILYTAWQFTRADDAVVAAIGCFLFAFWCGEMVQMLSGDTLTYWRVTPVFFAILGAAANRDAVHRDTAVA